jgi:hypothetical protein
VATGRKAPQDRHLEPPVNAQRRGWDSAAHMKDREKRER